MNGKCIPAIGLLLGALCWPALGAEHDFETVVGAIEAHLGVHRTHIPMLGFAKLFVKVSAPSGTHGFELATFEDLKYSPERLRDFRAVVSDALGGSWQPMVQVQAQGRSEYTGIFVRGRRGQFHLMITTIEAHEATVVEIQVSPSQWFAWLRDPGTMGKRSRHEDCCTEE
jgi:hypothetical protein